MKTDRIDAALGPGLAFNGQCNWINVRRISMVPEFEDPIAAKVAARVLKWTHPRAPKPQPVPCGPTHRCIPGKCPDNRLPSEIGIQAVPREVWRMFGE